MRIAECGMRIAMGTRCGIVLLHRRVLRCATLASGEPSASLEMPWVAEGATLASRIRFHDVGRGRGRALRHVEAPSFC